jgi:hypothetical protein
MEDVQTFMGVPQGTATPTHDLARRARPVDSTAPMSHNIIASAQTRTNDRGIQQIRDGATPRH